MPRKVVTMMMAELREMEARLSGEVPSTAAARAHNYYKTLLEHIGPRVCLSVVSFGVLVSLATFVVTISALVVGGVYVLRRRKATF